MIQDLQGKTMKFGGEDLTFHISHYIEGGDTAVVLATETGEMYAVLTVNIEEIPLMEGEILVKTWSENEEISKACLETGFFEDTGLKVPTGFVTASVWKVKV